MIIIFLIWSHVSILFIYYLTCQWTGHVTTRCQNFFSFFIANLHILLLFLYQRQFLQSENSAGKFPLTLQSRFAWNVQSTHVSVQNDKYNVFIHIDGNENRKYMYIAIVLYNLFKIIKYKMVLKKKKELFLLLLSKVDFQ